MRKSIDYKPEMRALVKKLRNTKTLGEVTLWREIKVHIEKVKPTPYPSQEEKN